jgi:hypothetical protein
VTGVEAHGREGDRDQRGLAVPPLRRRREGKEHQDERRQPGTPAISLGPKSGSVLIAAFEEHERNRDGGMEARKLK